MQRAASFLAVLCGTAALLGRASAAPAPATVPPPTPNGTLTFTTSAPPDGSITGTLSPGRASSTLQRFPMVVIYKDPSIDPMPVVHRNPALYPMPVVQPGYEIGSVPLPAPYGPPAQPPGAPQPTQRTAPPRRR